MSGSYESDSPFDGARRLVAFHSVANHPLAVAVTTKSPRWDVKQIGLRASFGVAFTLVVLSYVRRRARRLRDRERDIEHLTQSRAREADANQMKSRFVTLLSHELRTPLNAILGFSELLRDMPQHPENVRRAALIHDSGQHLLSLLNTLLDFAKIEAGRMQVDQSEVDLVDVTRTLVEVHLGSASKKGLTITFVSTLPAGYTVVADTDRTKYIQILNNVMSNAVKFTSSGGVSVHVSADASACLVQVNDTGCGIHPDVLPSIFDRFSHASTMGSSHEGGTCLGLSLSRELVRLLGGSIDVASQPGSGTQVNIQLPARLVEESQCQ